MAILRVDSVGLRMLAAHCQSWACEVVPADRPSTGTSWQVSSTATSDIDLAVMNRAELFAYQLRSIASTLRTAARNYEDRDQYSATRLEATPTGL